MTETSNLDDVISVFATHYPPANSISDADLKLTSLQIIEAIEAFDFSITDFSNLYQVMEDHGYRFVPVVENETLAFAWLIKDLSHQENQV